LLAAANLLFFTFALTGCISIKYMLNISHLFKIIFVKNIKYPTLSLRILFPAAEFFGQQKGF
jgi:hypothetical protein